MFRLDRLDRYALAQTFPLIPSDASAWLFGSRTDGNARGGDIDVLIQTDLPPRDRFDLSRILTLEFQRHCEEKIEFVVYPKDDLDPSQAAFLKTLKLIPLKRVVHAPLLHHVAILVADIEDARTVAARWGFPLQESESFEGEGTTEAYVGEDRRASRVLLMAASGPGPYRRALEKRGPGLHHIGVQVPSLNHFFDTLPGSGWLLHPKSVSAIRNGGTVFLARPGVPMLIEVWQAAPERPALLAPVVEAVRVQVSAEIDQKVSCLDIPELAWCTTQGSALRVGGEWIACDAVAHFNIP